MALLNSGQACGTERRDISLIIQLMSRIVNRQMCELLRSFVDFFENERNRSQLLCKLISNNPSLND
jgi:hypothetical protein